MPGGSVKYGVGRREGRGKKEVGQIRTQLTNRAQIQAWAQRRSAEIKEQRGWNDEYGAQFVRPKANTGSGKGGIGREERGLGEKGRGAEEKQERAAAHNA
jgi:hypothetical protein